MKNEYWIWAGFFAIVIVIILAFGFNFDETFMPSIGIYTDGKDDLLK